jgi:DUF971 family protein
MSVVPAKIRLAGPNNTIHVDWSDGHASVYEYAYLRSRCPCATCQDSEPEPGQPAGALPMLKKALKPERVEIVGRYAVQIYWNDGHNSGIYSYEYLRRLCPCPQCTAEARAAGMDDRQE